MQPTSFRNGTIVSEKLPVTEIISERGNTMKQSCKYSLVCTATEVPFHENLPPLRSRRSGVPVHA